MQLLDPFLGRSTQVDIYLFNSCFVCLTVLPSLILGDPGADSGGEGKSKRVEKYGTKKSKEWREEPLETISYQTSSKRSPPF